MKKIILLSCLGMGLFFEACGPSYVSTEPTYIEVVRPTRPSVNHVWIDGDWVYSAPQRTYIRSNGYWALSNGRVYAPGQWRRNKRGSYWVSGRWR